MPYNKVPGKVFEGHKEMHETETFPARGRLSNKRVQTIINVEAFWKLDFFLIYRIMKAESAILLLVNFRPG